MQIILIGNFPFFKKSLALFLIMAISLSFFAGVFPRREAKAQEVVSDIMQAIGTVWDVIAKAVDWAYEGVKDGYLAISAAFDDWFKGWTLSEKALRMAWYKVKREILRDLANAIIDWAKGESGTPAFITDWKGYLLNMGRSAVTKLINDQISSILMCYNFNLSLKASINWRDINLNNQLACPWGDPFVLQNFLSDFQRGGWDMWKGFIAPNGNMYGSHFIVSDALLEEEEREREAQKGKLEANQGYPGNESTPGILQSYATNKAAMMEWDYLMSSQEFEEFVFAVADAFIMRIIRAGITGVQTSSYSYSDPGATPPPQTAIDANQAAVDLEFVEGIRERLGSLSEEQQKLLSEQNTNLSIMQQIKTIQDTLIERECTPRTALIDSEITTLINEIAQTQTKISQAQQATLDNDALISAVQGVIAANEALDPAALNSALAIYRIARTDAIESFGILLENNETDLSEIYSGINDLLILTVQDANSYFQARGNSFASTGLEGRLTRENNALLACPPPPPPPPQEEPTTF